MSWDVHKILPIKVAECSSGKDRHVHQSPGKQPQADRACLQQESRAEKGDGYAAHSTAKLTINILRPILRPPGLSTPESCAHSSSALLLYTPLHTKIAALN